jgi:3-oxoacyl-[acyl-carrier-protein] synthase-1
MFVTATGMVCAVGTTAASACAAMRAGIAGFTELPYHDNQGEPIIGAMVADLPLDLKRGARLIEMLSMALVDCLGKKPTWPLEQIPLLVGIGRPERPGVPAKLSQTIVKDVQAKLGWKFHPTCSQAIAKEHTAGFEGLRLAREFVNNEKIPACVVCGVDSYINASSLLWLDRHRRLKTPENRDGAIPGEAAAVVVVEKKTNPRAVIEVVGLGFGEEKAHVLNDEPLLGLGLTQAVRTALGEAKIGLHEVDCRLSDVTGELYGFKELPLLEGRLMRVVRKQEQPIWHWSQAIGDTGAAAGVAELVLANAAVHKKYAPGDRFLGMASAVPGERGAAVIRRSVMEPEPLATRKLGSKHGV